MSETYVYRAFDGAGRLLYVGCSNDVEARMKAHGSSSPWTVYMRSTTIEAFPTRTEAAEAEAKAIAEEHPRWNVVGRSIDHPDGYATSAQGADWLRPERAVAHNLLKLRSDVARTRAKLRRLTLELRMEEAMVEALANGLIDTSEDDLLGELA